MNKEQVIKFTKKINFGIDFPVIFYTNKKDTFAAWHKCIRVNDKIISSWIKINLHHVKLIKSWDFYIRQLIAHELGHEYTRYKNGKYIKSKILKELEADFWAIDRLRELKYNKSAEYIINRYENYFNSREYIKKYWNTNYRRYILAGKLYKTAIRN